MVIGYTYLEYDLLRAGTTALDCHTLAPFCDAIRHFHQNNRTVALSASSLEPFDFLTRLAALVLNSCVNLTRFHSVLHLTETTK